jgi:hypothetical protein
MDLFGVQTPKDLWSIRYEQRRRLAAATRIAQSALARLTPVIRNAMAIRMEEGKDVKDQAKIKEATEKLAATRGATAGIKHLMISKMQTPEDKMRHLQGLQLQNRAVKSKGGAQCGELSYYVFHRCYEEKLFPFHQILAEKVNLLNNPNDNHAYVAIGLENPGKQSDMATWPEDVVICDPWVMELIRGTAQASGSNPGAYTAAQYMNLVKPYFANKGSVTVQFGHTESLDISINPVIGGERVPFGTKEIFDRTRPLYQLGYKFGLAFKRGAYPAAASAFDWWDRLVAALTLPVACKIVGLPNPPNWKDRSQLDRCSLFEAGCKAGSK